MSDQVEGFKDVFINEILDFIGDEGSLLNGSGDSRLTLNRR